MGLNHKKSKVMNFRRHPQSGGGLGGDLLVDGVLFTQPKPHQGSGLRRGLGNAKKMCRFLFCAIDF